MTGRNILNVDSVPNDIFIVDHLVIGNYAYQFLWSNADRCSTTGIYTFQLLKILAENDKAVIINLNFQIFLTHNTQLYFYYLTLLMLFRDCIILLFLSCRHNQIMNWQNLYHG